MKKLVKYGLIGGIVVGALFSLFLDFFGFFFVNAHKNDDDKLVTKFIVETRSSWNHIREGFYTARQMVYISRSAEINEMKILNREMDKLANLKAELKKVTANLNDERQQQQAHNVLILISNATDELKRSVESYDVEITDKCIDNANKEIELANVQFLKIAQENGYTIEPLTLVRKGLD